MKAQFKWPVRLHRTPCRYLWSLVLMGILGYSLLQITLAALDHHTQNATMEKAQQLYHTESPVNASIQLPDDSENSHPPPMFPGMAALQEINSDVVAWITVPDTIIDYPVVQGEDNLQYLDRDWQGNSNRAGAIFMDYRNDPKMLASPGKHTILYGHHMRDGSMFQPLIQFKDPEFIDANPVFYLNDLYEHHLYEIFSVYVTTTDFYYIETNFNSEADFTDFVQEIQDRSIHHYPVTLSESDHILTLSTCTYEYDDARMVIHARRIP